MNFRDFFFVTYPVGRQTTKTFYLIFLGQKNDISDIKGVGSQKKYNMGWWGLKFADVIYKRPL